MAQINDGGVMSWEQAIRACPAKCYRKTKNGRYEAFCSDHSRSIFLGTHDTPNEAVNAVFEYKANRLKVEIEKYGLHLQNGVSFMTNYIAFPNGMIFNLHGERMIGAVNRDGYIHGIFDGKNIQFHRIIASLFCTREFGKDYVNHIDGNKRNNNSTNLEWCTKSENTLHSFRTGLQTCINGSPVYTENEKRYIKAHCFDNHHDVATKLGRKPDTVRKYMYKYRKEFLKDD